MVHVLHVRTYLVEQRCMIICRNDVHNERDNRVSRLLPLLPMRVKHNFFSLLWSHDELWTTKFFWELELLESVSNNVYQVDIFYCLWIQHVVCQENKWYYYFMTIVAWYDYFNFSNRYGRLMALGLWSSECSKAYISRYAQLSYDSLLCLWPLTLTLSYFLHLTISFFLRIGHRIISGP